MKKKYDSSKLKWDDSGLFLYYTQPNGKVKELFIEEALNLGLKLPKRPNSDSADDNSGPTTKSQDYTDTGKYTGRWKKLLSVENFLRDKTRFLALPRLKQNFAFEQATQGYFSCLLELIFVFEDYFWAFNSKKRLSAMDEFTEIFGRYSVRDNNLAMLKARVNAALGDALTEFKKWSALLNIDPLSTERVSELTKLLMDAGFASWIKLYLRKGLGDINPTSRPNTVKWFCQRWNEHERYRW